jgi:hypothetical protein
LPSRFSSAFHLTFRFSFGCYLFPDCRSNFISRLCFRLHLI